VVEAGAVVAAAVEGVRPLVEAQRHTLTVSVAEGALRVRADPARLTQVLTNLLNNAAKYTPEGGRIWVSAAREAGEVVFRVKDTGTGIPREMLGKVFDLFTQVDRALDRSQGGLGIGLTLVRRLVEMHGGSVLAQSEGLGHGAEFTVRLPLCQDEPASEAGQAGRPEPPGGPLAGAPCRVLVVDDNASAADGLAVLLRLGGYEVHLAHDGRSALEVARAFRPDVVLLDIGLPELDGYEVAHRLRQQPATRDVLLVAVTGYGQVDDVERARAAGFDHHFTKPVDYAVLRQVLPVEGRRALAE
jgi:two-component system CheB/CheR fusion protein